MAKYIQDYSLMWRSLLIIFQSGLVLSTMALGLSEPVKARTPLENATFSSDRHSQQSESADTNQAAEQAYNEGDRLYRQGTAESLKAAIAKFSEALQLYQSAGDTKGEAATLINIGGVYFSLGEMQLSLDYYNQALPLWSAVGDKKEEAITLNLIGEIYSLKEFQKALEYANRALQLYREIGDRKSVAFAMIRIGFIYSAWNQFPQALDYANQALPLYQAIGDRPGVANTLHSIGHIYRDLGEFPQALNYLNQALPLWQAEGIKGGEAATLMTIGNVYSDLGDYQQALDYFNRALPLSRAIGDRRGESYILGNIGKVYSKLGDNQQALNYYNRALPLSRAIGDRPREAETLYWIAIANRDTSNLKDAVTHIEATLAIVENLRTKISSQNVRASYFATVQERYEFYIDLLMQLHKNNPSQGYDAKALQVSEKARARSLLEILTEANADIRAGADPQLLQQERTFQQQLDSLETQRIKLLSGNPTNSQKAELEKQTEALLSQYQDLQAQIRAKSPGYAALTQPQPLNLQEIQQQVLDEDTMLLEYSLGEKRSYLWAVTKTGLSSYELPARAEIEKAARDFQLALTSPSKRNLPKLVAKSANALGEIILKPVADRLAQKRLLIVADGALQYIPFSGITLPGKLEVPLIVEHEIVALPSASTLAILRRDTAGRQKAPKAIAVLADPIFGTNDDRLKVNSAALPNSSTLPIEAQQLQRAADDAGVKWNRLPFTETEAKQILALVPEAEEKQALGFAANRTTATNPELSQYRIVHFATHGFANSENPELSGIVLSLLDEKGALQNGYLRLHDIYNLNLPAELIVLSACQTGLGKNIKGEGLVSLTRGFMYAGSPRVVVSLWQVDDKATAELMVRFYQKMLKEGLAPAAALRAAQVEMLQQTEWKSPYYWAAFGLQGEWK